MVFIPLKIPKCYFLQKYAVLKFHIYKDVYYIQCLKMTTIIITFNLFIPSQLGRKKSGTDLGTEYGGTVCGFHTRPVRGNFRTS